MAQQIKIQQRDLHKTTIEPLKTQSINILHQYALLLHSVIRNFKIYLEFTEHDIHFS